MATKKAPAKKAPAKKIPAKKVATKKTTSAAQKRIAENKMKQNRIDTRGRSGMGATAQNAKRMDRARSSGFGMTKTGVNDRAIDAGNRRYLDFQSMGGADYSQYGNLMQNAYGGPNPKASDKKIDKEQVKAFNNVRGRYGMKPVSSKQRLKIQRKRLGYE